MESRVYECDTQQIGNLKKLLESDPYADKSFARQGYKLKDGGVIGADKSKSYLYIKADSDFFKSAEEKFKEVSSMKRSEKKLGETIIMRIEEEEGFAEQGFGAIFG